MEKQEYINLLNQVIGLIKMRRDEQMDTIFNYGDYGLKPMFAEKYSIAYTACLDDIALGEEPEVNVSVYQDGALVNIDLSYNEFLELYRAVKDIFKGIEKKYQQYLAELSQNPSQERLKEIIESGEF